MLKSSTGSESKFAGLRLTLETDDQREQSNRRSWWFNFFPQQDEAKAITTLHQIFALTRARLRSATAGETEELEVQRLAVQLFEGVAGWAFAAHLPMLTSTTVNKSLMTFPKYQRRIAHECLMAHLPIVPPFIRRGLAHALDALDDGDVYSILEPMKGGRRGREPSVVADIEELFLAWIEREGSRKPRSKAKAKSQVAAACGISVQAIDNWKKNLPTTVYSVMRLQ